MTDKVVSIDGMPHKLVDNGDGTYAKKGVVFIVGSLAAENSWSLSADSEADTAKTLTKTASAGVSHYITAFEVVISGAAAVATITVELKEDAAGDPVTKWKTVIGIASPIGTRVGITLPNPIKITTNKTADLVVTAGGANVVTSCNLAGFTL